MAGKEDKAREGILAEAKAAYKKALEDALISSYQGFKAAQVAKTNAQEGWWRHLPQGTAQILGD